MKDWLKYLMIGFVALGIVGTSFAATITVNWSGQVSTYLALSNGTYISASDNALIEVGTFASPPTDGSSNLVGFTAFASSTNAITDGGFSVSSSADEAGFSHTQIYLVVQDGSQLGIFYINEADNTNWRFPAGTDFPNDTSIDIEDLVNNPTTSPTLKTGAHIVFGSLAFDLAGFTQLRLAATASPPPPPPPPPPSFVPVAGSFSGLVASNVPTQATTGFLNLTMTDTGSFSATLSFGKNRLTFKGQFDESGDYSTSLTTKLGTFDITLHGESVDGTDQITGTVSNGSFTSDVLAKLNVSSPATQFQGYYTLLFEPDSAGADFPQGNGYGVFTIDASGILKLKGALGDGTKIKQTAVVSEDGSWPVYIPVSKTGLLSGWITFTNIVGVSDLNGTLTWTKPSGGKTYPNGFTGTVSAEGSHYTPPPAGTPALTVSNTTCNVLFTAGAGNLSSVLSNSVTLDVANKLTPCVADKSKFKVTATTGLFSGSFPNPVTGKGTKFSGALLQKQNLGAGFFLGTDQSGFATLAPTP